MGRGGRRPGAGRKPKHLGQLADVVNHPSVPVLGASVQPPMTNGECGVDEFNAPNDLLADERAIWLKQAPHAYANQTLTTATAMAFERYCKLTALERRIAQTSDVGKADHRGLLRQINDLELQFRLSPNGKPVADASRRPEQPESKLSRFRKASA